MSLLDGLIAWYDLADDATEQHAGLDATNVGGITFDGDAATFAGLNTQYAQTPITALPASAWSYMCFVRNDDPADAYHGVWHKGRGTATPEMVALFAGSATYVQLGVYKAAGGSSGANVVALPLGAWVCLYGEYAGETIWAQSPQGVSNEPQSLGARAEGAEPIEIGRDPGYPLLGKIKRFALWDRALTQEERDAFYNEGAGLRYAQIGGGGVDLNDLNSEIAAYVGAGPDLTTSVTQYLTTHATGDATADFQRLIQEASR